MEKFALFLFILSLVYSLKWGIQLIVKLKETDPTPIAIDNLEKLLLYLTIAYAITYIIGNIIW